VSHHYIDRHETGICFLCQRSADDPIHVVAARQYSPAEWCDEVMPELGNSPDDFLRRDAEGVLRLSAIDEDNRETWDEPISAGQIVEFMWTEIYPDRVLTWDDDGNWSLDQPAPPMANCFRPSDGDYEDICDDPADIVQAALSGEREEYHSPMTLEVWGWQDAGKYRVKVLESGAATFEPVPAGEVAQ
jgi:hypothetical protein